MNAKVFSGSAVAIVTPFDEQGIDHGVLERLIERQLEADSDAIVICGTTGEASTMPDAEHIEAVASAVRIVAGRRPVIAGAGSNDTRHAVDLARACEEAGADALLCVTPYYNKTSQAGLVEHFRLSAEATGLPIILYNVPSRTNLNIVPETYARLFELPNIVGTKECNLGQVAQTRHLCGPDFVHYSGEDGYVLPLLALGGSGVNSVVANLIPDEMRRLTHAALDSDYETARALQIALSPLIAACFCDVNPIPVKYALRRMGIAAGAVRLPLVDLGPEQQRQVDRALVAHGLLDAAEAGR